MDPKIAYISSEFALDDSLPIYAGGLGILAGDILYQAADSNLPIAGITVFYRDGFFKQIIEPDGTQRNFYENVTPKSAGLIDTGKFVKVPLTDHELILKIWERKVTPPNYPVPQPSSNAAPLYLMDADIEENRPEDRKITDRLYERVWAPHIIDDVVLGVGSVRSARALGLPIEVWHINDDHGTMNIFERIREFMAEGTSLEEARQKVKEETVFTTHTPVAGAESKFTREELLPILTVLFAGINVDLDEFWKLGVREWEGKEFFSLTVFAMRHSREVNAVSKKHFEVSKKLWEFIGEDVPTTFITNAVYSPRWTPPEFKDAEIREQENLNSVNAKLEAKKRTAQEIREVSLDNKTFDPNALVLAWCRRFAKYKQPTLLLSDPDRLIKILTDEKRPVYLLMAGKAHPDDEEGQGFVKQVVEFSRRPEVKDHLIYVPDYNLSRAHELLAASDVWLSTPVVGWEASATSGMKAVYNRSLNAMTPDGWWPEGFNGKNGWVIEPKEDDYATVIYELIENKVVPTFYDDHDEWNAMVQEALSSCGEKFDTQRMLGEYAKMYGVTS